MIRVAVVEDHAGFRASLATLLQSTAHCACVGAFANAASALDQLSATHPDVVLMDLHLPGEDGLACVRQLAARVPEVPIVMLTVEENSRLVFAALEAGASGYLVKGDRPEAILEAVEEAHRGGSPMSSPIARLVVQSFHKPVQTTSDTERLTKRELELLSYLARGWSSKEIAGEFGISIYTVHTHLRHIYEKLHVRNRTAAASKFLRS